MEISYPREEIESQRLRLKRLNPELAVEIFAAIEKDRKRLGLYLPWVEYVTELENELSYIDAAKKYWMNGEQFDFCLYRISDRKFLGVCGAHAISWDHQRLEFGYWLTKEAEGEGFMSEAVQLLEKEFFSLGFNRIEIRCEPQNSRSKALPERLGYKFEGILEEQLFAMNKFRDTAVFAKLKKNLSSV